MPKKKQRLDVFLVENGYIVSRSLAQSLILSGKVLVDDVPITKVGQNVSETSKIRIKDLPNYVSRAGEKMKKAIDAFELNIEGFHCVDIGSSTGGFTDCMLQHGAKKVYAIDCGTNQLDFKLRNHSQVVVHENTNAKNLTSSFFQEPINLVTFDVSFISIQKLIPPVIEATRVQEYIMALVKPQFEGEKEDVDRGGIVRSLDTHRKIVSNVFHFLEEHALHASAFTYSPLTGKKGNIEYLLLIDMKKKSTKISKEIWETVIDEAFNIYRSQE